MPSSRRYSSILKQRRKESKASSKLINILFKSIDIIAESTSKAIKKTVNKSNKSKGINNNTIIICPICGCIVTNKNYNGLSFNNDKICSNCQKIIENHFGGRREGTIYLDDLKEIVRSYYNK